MNPFDELPRRDQNHQIEDQALAAFQKRLADSGCFILQASDRKDYGTDCQIEAGAGGQTIQDPGFHRSPLEYDQSPDLGDEGFEKWRRRLSPPIIVPKQNYGWLRLRLRDSEILSDRHC